MVIYNRCSLSGLQTSAEKSIDNLRGMPLYVTSCLALLLLKLSLTVYNLIIIRHSVGLYGFILFGKFGACLFWISVSLPR